MIRFIRILCFIFLSLTPLVSHAHHVLGRPAYSLNEDSNTPPSMEVETSMGDYNITYMVFPAFPKPGARGRINLYAVNIKTGKPYNGEVHFSVRDDSWFSSNEEDIGTQEIDDGVYRQGFVIQKEGNYIVTAHFIANNEPYIIDFPLTVGVPSEFTLPVIIIGAIFVFLIIISLIQRRRLMQMRIKDNKE